MTKNKTGTAAIAILALATLGGCGPSEAENAAQAAYDACATSEASKQMLKLDGARVIVALEGDAAREFSTGGLGAALALYVPVDCLAEHTGFPGGTGQLEDGDTWDGWEYTYRQGAGSEESHTFTATS